MGAFEKCSTHLLALRGALTLSLVCYAPQRSESDDAVIEKPTKEFRLSLEEARHDQRRKSSEYHECSAFMEEHGSIMMLQVGRRHAAFPTNIPLKLHTVLPPSRQSQ